jgi:hypothetical protein
MRKKVKQETIVDQGTVLAPPRTLVLTTAFFTLCCTAAFMSVLAGVFLFRSETPQPASTTGLTELDGWPYLTSDWVRNSPAVIDCNGDGTRDVVFGSFDGNVYAVESNGTLLWSFNVGGDVRQSPAVGNIDADPEPEIIIGKGNSFAPPPFNLYAFNRDGSQAWAAPVTVSGALQGSAVLANLDSDPELEIIVATYGISGNNVYALDGNGATLSGWPQAIPSPIWATPAIGNLDADGEPEIIVPLAAASGNVLAFNHGGSPVSGWTVTINDVIRSSPALGDIDADGKDEVFVVGENGNVHGFDHTGTPLGGLWPISLPNGTWSSPVLYDIDADSRMELLLAADMGSFYMWDAQTGQPEPGWPIHLGLTQSQPQSSPIIADIDNDGALEIVVGMRNKLCAFELDGTVITYFTTTVGMFAESTPTIADMNGDGNFEVFMGDDQNRMHAYRIGPISPSKAPWGTFQQSYLRTGRVAGCYDGTVNNACSTTKPYRCQNGALIKNCQQCLCAGGLQCLTDGSCGTVPPAPPVLEPIGTQTAYIGTYFRKQLVATDANGDTLTYSSPWLPPNASLNAQTGLFTWLLSGDQSYMSQYSITFVVSDGHGGSDSETVRFNVKVLSSFLPGTMIRLADGSEKAIESIRVGDRVRSYNETTKRCINGMVRRIFRYETDGYYIINGRTHVTAEHPLLVNGRWTKVKDIREGDRLMAETGASVPVTSFGYIPENATVYNLTVAPFETYIADGVVVHNKPPVYRSQIDL